jgi:hypothetical protein
MNQWSFVIAAYAVAVVGTAALLAWAFVAMRAAEVRAESLKERQ